MKHYVDAYVLKNTEVTSNIFEMTLKCDEIVSLATAGQFINLFTGDFKHILPRPISICSLDKENGHVTIVYQVVGSGTKIFSNAQKGDFIKVLGPLGNGFEKNTAKGKYALIGGGVGIFPLLELCKQLQGEVDVYLGYRDKAFYHDRFSDICNNVYISSDNGENAFKGNVMELFLDKNIKYDAIYSCGPTVMLKAVSEYANANSILAHVSLEERMACGIGACLGCVVPVKKGEEIIKQKVCKDGPVFLSSEVVFR